LYLIKDEEDLQNYRNLLNAMAAIFYTSHRMKNDVQTIFQQWLQATRLRIQQRGGIKERKKPGAIDQNLRAVPAIEIDTELAN